MNIVLMDNKKPAAGIFTDDFAGKITGSVVENPHYFSNMQSQSILTPSEFTIESNNYSLIYVLDGTVAQYATNIVVNMRGQHYTRYNLIALIERKGGQIPAATTADKVIWLKANIKNITASHWGYGARSVDGVYGVTFQVWNLAKATWSTVTVTHANPNITKMSYDTAIESANIGDFIDANGNIGFSAYSVPATSTQQAVMATDYVQIVVTI